MKKLFGKLSLLAAALACLSFGAVFAACEPAEPDDHEHLYGQWELIAAATCDENGSRKHTCTVCGKSEEEDIPALGHDWDGGKETKIATCSEEGERTTTCRRCQKKKTEPIPKTAHNWGEPVIAPGDEADCTKEGKATLTCLECNTSQTVTIDKDAHRYTVLETKDANCKDEGYIDYICEVCSEPLRETLAPLGHQWIAGQTDREATCTVPGKRDRRCARCGTEEESEIPAPGHLYEGDFTIDIYPTFETEGSKSHHCVRCGQPGEATVIPKLEENVPITYEFRVLRNNGALLNDAGIVVSVYDGAEKVAESTRSTLVGGKFTAELNPKTYTVQVTNLPAGYSAEAQYVVEAGDPRCDLYLTAAPIKEAPTKTTRYSIGSVMHDFTLTPSMTSDGKSYTLSELLSTKKAVVLNFWATWCGPCQREFPALGSVYTRLHDSIAVLAIDQSASDNLQKVKQYATSNSIPFPMAFDLTNRLQSMFGVSNIPATVVIDGEGVVCEIHTGSVPTEEYFLSLFSPYLADSYWKNPAKKTSAAGIAATEAILPDKRALAIG